MRRAISLAQIQLGRTGDNPTVGCVLVRDAMVVGQGATGPGGRPHAEEVALADAGDRAGGATAYVTLEPCAERSSGSKSCADRLIAAGVHRVVIACADPSILAAGRGIERLVAADVSVTTGVLTGEAQALYREYRPRRA